MKKHDEDVGILGPQLQITGATNAEILRDTLDHEDT
jgi:hypothetical protein